METAAHSKLKSLALRYLRTLGCAAVACEVQCPLSRYRVDVAGFQDRVVVPSIAGDSPVNGGRDQVWERCEPRTTIIECKQSRADFLHHAEDLAALLEMRETLAGINRSIEQNRVMVEEPHLRANGSSLFPELEDWDLSASRLACYRESQRRLRRLEQRIHGHTKFHLLWRYALADQLYVAAPAGMVHRREVPHGWGLLEWDGESAPDDSQRPFTISVPAPVLRCRPERRNRLLRNIAVAASRAARW